MIARDWRPLALERGEGYVVAAHDLADALAQEERAAAHAEVGVEVRNVHGTRVALEEGDVVGLQQRGEELDEDAVMSTHVDLHLHGQTRTRRLELRGQARARRVHRLRVQHEA
jgi:hypothetical protein